MIKPLKTDPVLLNLLYSRSGEQMSKEDQEAQRLSYIMGQTGYPKDKVLDVITGCSGCGRTH